MPIFKKKDKKHEASVTLDTVWQYQGFDSTKLKRVKGSVPAVSTEAALLNLRERGIVDITVKPSGKVKLLTDKYLSPKSNKISPKEIIFLIRSMARNASGGITMADSLELIADGCKRKSNLRSILLSLRTRMKDSSDGPGKAFAHYSKELGDDVISVIASGHKTSTLPSSLEALADSKETRHEIKRSVRSALLSPIFPLVLTLGMAVGSAVFLLPQFSNFAEVVQSDAEPKTPHITTQSLFTLRDLILNYYLFTLLLITLLGVLIIISLYNKTISLKISRWMLSAPLFGKIILLQNTVIISEIFGYSFTSGQRYNETLSLARDAVPNKYVKQALKDMHESRILLNLKFSEVIERYTPPLDRVLVLLAKQSDTGIEDPGLPWTGYAESGYKSLIKSAEQLRLTIKTLNSLVLTVVISWVSIGLTIPQLDILEAF